MKIYNSLSRSVEEFKSREKGRVKIFTCGPSIYRRPHIGNYRTFLYEDVLVRYLEFLGYRVDRIINFTDVEDKSISEAEEKNTNVKDLTEDAAAYFYSETKALGIKLPPEIPKSSTSVDEAAMIIARLMEKGYAYRYGKDVFFAPLKKKDFGKLYRLDMSAWPKRTVRFKKDTYNGRRWNRGDFILWHGYSGGSEPFWDTVIGRGRPSWNIQDPAMIVKHLGDQVDINCGGIDNIFRHHDYNIAVMESYSGKPYANYYMHGEHLFVNGKPMSKSRGNILYPGNIGDMGYSERHLRFYLTYTHYRAKLNFTEKDFAARAGLLDEFTVMVQALTAKGGEAPDASSKSSVMEIVGGIEPRFRSLMDEDLSLGKAFDMVNDSVRRILSLTSGKPLSSDLASALRSSLGKLDTVFRFLPDLTDSVGR